MATTQTKNGAPTFDAAFEQVKELNEQVLAAHGRLAPYTSSRMRRRLTARSSWSSRLQG